MSITKKKVELCATLSAIYPWLLWCCWSCASKPHVFLPMLNFVLQYFIPTV